ncbi:MAG: hypothetical protein KA384_07900 [Leptotrichiaceae bacterium]|jgi:hypothetical protein|nr:hypothetical protein [Leptotrichiaceae bacterium]
MTFVEFKKLLDEKQLFIEDIAPLIGYSNDSINNNWSKNNFVPKKAEILINLYFELTNIKNENKILKENDINKIEISDTALKIVKKKSMEKNISIKEYVSSLIISRI